MRTSEEVKNPINRIDLEEALNPFEPLGPKAEMVALSTIELPDGRLVGRSQQVKVEIEGVVSFGVVVWMIDGNAVDFSKILTALGPGSISFWNGLSRFKISVRNWIWTALS